MNLTAACMLFFQFFPCFSGAGTVLLAEVEVTKAIRVVRGFAPVVVLGCLRAESHHLHPYPLELPRPGGAAVVHTLGGCAWGWLKG